MRNPYEFGYAVGQYEKTADISGFARGAWDVGKYMIPGVGTAYSLGDAFNSARSGNVLGTLGNLALAGTSLIPGAGGLLGGAAKGVGKGLMRAGARVGGNMAGRGLVAAGRAMRVAPVAMRTAGRAAQGVNSAMAKGVQKVVPVNAATKSWTRMGVNKAVQNPLTVAGYGSTLAGGVAPATAAGAAPAPPPPMPQARPMVAAGM
jgi:hypothetical protein